MLLTHWLHRTTGPSSQVKRNPPRNRLRVERRRQSTTIPSTSCEVLEQRALLAAGLVDIDKSGDADALSDGLLLVRRFANFDGDVLIDGVIAADALRSTADTIISHIDANNAEFDIDLNNSVDPLSDGATIVKAIAGFTGDVLVNGTVDPAGQRTDPQEVLDHIRGMFPELFVSEVSPINGAGMVNVTRNAVVRFEGKVDPNSITDDAFHLIANGARVPGRISVSRTGRFATFIPTDPLPPQTEVRVVINGDQIRNRNGVLLDGDADGQPGGKQANDFSTLPLARIAGTNVFGFVRDSRTQEPIVGATIRVDAFPDANAVTDASGRFLLENMPAPEFFVHIDGSTATNALAGFAYPNVGKPFHSVPGQEVQLNHNGTVFDVFLPPMATADVQDLSETDATDIGFGTEGKSELLRMFPELPASTWDALQLNVSPGAAIDDEGNPVTQATIIPVPPDRLPAPLPPNFDPALVISVQAFGATSFDVPAPITFPNLDNLPAGSKATLFSFDHDVGEFLPIGLGTVSDDGSVIVSDPGVGVVAPGWHFSSPPLNWASGTRPAGNRPASTETPPEVSSQLVSTSAGDVLGFSFSPPPGAGQAVGQHRLPTGEANPMRLVNVRIEGPLQDYYKLTRTDGIASPASGQLPNNQTIRLVPGDAPVHIEWTQKNLTELKRDLNANKLFEKNLLYGSKITVSETLLLADGTIERSRRIVFPYMLIDATDPTKNDLQLQFATTANDDVGGFFRLIPLELRTGGAAAAPNLSLADTANFFIPIEGGTLRFDPKTEGNALTTNLIVANPQDGAVAGTVALTGKGVKRQGWRFDVSSYETLTERIANDTTGTAFPRIDATERGLFSRDYDTDPAEKSKKILDAIAAETKEFFAEISSGFLDASFGIFQATAAADNVLNVKFVEGANPAAGSNRWGLGGATDAFSATDVDLATAVALYNNRDQYSQLERAYRLAETLNGKLTGEIEFKLDNYLEVRSDIDTPGELRNAFGHNNAHEIGHHLGLFHTWTTSKSIVGGAIDVMAQGAYLTDSQQFNRSAQAMLMGLHIAYTGADADKALKYYLDYNAEGGNWNQANLEGDGSDDEVGPGNQITEPTIGLFSEDDEIIFSTFDLGTVLADGAGGDAVDTFFNFSNLGPDTLTLTDVSFSDDDAVIALSPDLSGTTLTGVEVATLDIAFDPTDIGVFTRDLTITGDNGESFVVTIIGTAVNPEPVFDLRIANDNNNFGGVEPGASRQIDDLVTITNLGAKPLEFTPELIRGADSFLTDEGILGRLHELAAGESIQLPIRFEPTATGLIPGLLRFSTNDPDQPTIEQGFVGTGIPTGGIGENDFDWGDDFAFIEHDGFVQRKQTNAVGDFMFEVPVTTEYDFGIVDPVSGYIARSAGRSGPAGALTDLTRALAFVASTEPDRDFDGLPADLELIIGTSDNNPDTDNDGDDDFSEVSNNTNPLDGVIQTLGIIATLPTRGAAHKLDVQVDPVTGQQIVFAATQFGLEIFDTSNPQLPISLGSLDLGSSADVSVTGDTAVVVKGAGGFDLVDVSDPMLPVLRTVAANGQTENGPTPRVDTPFPVTHVEIWQDHAFMAGEDILVTTVDTGAEVDRLDLPGSGSVTGMARYGDLLFAFFSGFGSGDTLFTIDISVPTNLEILSQFSINVASRDVGVSVSRDTVHVFGSGLRNIDVSDPRNPFVVGAPAGGAFFTARDGAADGSGRVAIAQEDQGVGIFDVSDRGNTAALLAQFDTPASAQSIEVIGGLAFVADLGGGIHVINYLQRDNAGAPPQVSLITPPDGDPDSPGLQIVEGRSNTLSVEVTDDVLVRSVELLVDGRVVSTDPAFPFDDLLLLEDLIDGDTPVTIQARATDTGGNVGVSRLVTINVIPDEQPPRIDLVSPGDDDFIPTSSIFTTFSFTESLNPDTVDVSKFKLIQDSNQQEFAATELRFSRNNRAVDVLFGDLPAGGLYTFEGNFAGTMDVVGNAMPDVPIELSYTAIVADTVFTNPAGGEFSLATNWSNGVPGAGQIGFILPSTAIVRLPFNIDADTIFNRGTFTMTTATSIRSDLINGPTGVIDIRTRRLRIQGDHDLQNLGTIRLSESQDRIPAALEINGDGQLINEVGGVIVSAAINDDLGFNVLDGDVVNRGRFDVKGDLRYENTGTFQHEASGQFLFDEFATLGIQSAEFVQNGGSLSGTRVDLLGGTFTVMEDFTMPDEMVIIASARAEINGPGTLTIGPNASLDVFDSTVNAPLANQGLILTRGSRIAFNGAITNEVSGTIRLRGTAESNDGFVTINQGVTNHGLFELISTQTDVTSVIGDGVTLTLGELEFVNETDGTFSVPAAVGLNPERVINGMFDNRGTLNVLHDTRFSTAAGSTQPPAVTNSGTIHIGDENILRVIRGTFTHDGGTFATNELVLDGTTLTLSTDLTIPENMTVRLINNSLVTGIGDLTVSQNALLDLQFVTVETDIVNNGDILARTGRPEIAGALDNEFFGTVTVQGNAAMNDAKLTLTGGGTNKGRIELTSTLTDAASTLGDRVELSITGDPLINAEDGTIVAQPIVGLAPFTTISGKLANFGTLDVNADLVVAGLPGVRGSFNNVDSTIDIADGTQLLVLMSDMVFNNATFIGDQLVLDHAELALAADLTIPADFTLIVGNASAVVSDDGHALTIAENANLIVRTDIDVPLINQGTTTLERFSTLNAAVTNASTGMLLVSGSSDLGNANATATAGLTNLGTLKLTSTAMPGTLQSGFGDTATLTVSGGDLINEADGLIVSEPGGAVAPFRAITGNIDNRGDLQVDFSLSLLIGSADTGNLTNSGLVGVNGGQTFTVSGDYTQTAAGFLGINIGGPGIDEFGHLMVLGDATLAGVLDVNLFDGFLPALGTKFEFLTFAARAGTEFATIEVHGGSISVEVLYTDTTATIDVTAVPPPPGGGAVFEPIAPLALLPQSNHVPELPNGSRRLRGIDSVFAQPLALGELLAGLA